MEVFGVVAMIIMCSVIKGSTV